MNHINSDTDNKYPKLLRSMSQEELNQLTDKVMGDICLMESRYLHTLLKRRKTFWDNFILSKMATSYGLFSLIISEHSRRGLNV
jgi:hypothetical protein